MFSGLSVRVGALDVVAQARASEPAPTVREAPGVGSRGASTVECSACRRLEDEHDEAKC